MVLSRAQAFQLGLDAVVVVVMDVLVDEAQRCLENPGRFNKQISRVQQP